jgi:sarcosine oxidase delta subunit
MSSADSSHIYCIEPLHGADNYAIWKVRMLHILTDLSYEDHIAKNPTIPNDCTALAAWNKADLSTIVLHVADNVLVYISSKKMAKEAWFALSSMYEAEGAVGITLMHWKFHHTTCPEDSDIKEHIHLMHSYGMELSHLSCPVQNNKFTYTLLKSLPESWDNFVSAISDDIAQDPTKLIACMLTEDSHHHSHTSPDLSTALPAVDMSKIKCYECGQLGHYASKHCQQQLQQNQSWNQGQQPFNHRGHGRYGKSKAHIAIDDQPLDDEDFGFLVQEPSIAKYLHMDDWLLDSGCSRSIVCNRDSFTHYIATPGHKITGLGETTGIGCSTVPLSFAVGKKSQECILQDVLHCPTAPFNLISVS